MFYLIDLERSRSFGAVVFWKAYSRGYTTDIEEAGTYNKEQAENAVSSDVERLTIKISDKLAHSLHDPQSLQVVN